jgi:hypothetical protein
MRSKRQRERITIFFRVVPLQMREEVMIQSEMSDILIYKEILVLQKSQSEDMSLKWDRPSDFPLQM